MTRASGLPLLSLLLLAGCTADVASHPELVDYYSPQREEALYPRPLPFLAHYRRGGEFGFVAVVHASSPDHPTFRVVEHAFDVVRPEIVLLEGFPTSWGPDPARIVGKLASADPQDSYAAGEDMFAARLAHARGARILGTEPDDKQLADKLRVLGFANCDLFFASMFGPLAQDLDAGLFKDPQDPRFAESYAKWAAVNAPTYDATAPRDADAFARWFQQNYGRALKDDPRWFTRGGPGQQGLAARIARESNRIRDQHMVELATQQVRQRRRVLLIAGGSHLSSQWRALAEAMGEPAILGTGEPS